MSLMRNDEIISVSAHELMIARYERSNKRLWILTLLLIIFLVATNFGWLVYESQYQVTETSSVEQEIDTGDGDGDTTVIGIGDYNGESKTDGNKNTYTH